MTQLMDAEGNLMGLINSRRSSSNNDESEMDNKLLSYEPMMNKIKYPEIEAYLNDLQRARNLENIESSKSVIVAPRKDSPKLVSMDQRKAVVAPSLPVLEQSDSSPDTSSSARDETMKLIAHNSREIRLMGPEEREVEMKDDAATKMAVAIDNLKKEAGEVWGQVNTKLDKGWTDFKAMVDDAVESAKKKSGPNNTSTMDEISAAADMTVKTIKDQAEVAGVKIKGFFNNLGINV